MKEQHVPVGMTRTTHGFLGAVVPFEEQRCLNHFGIP